MILDVFAATLVFSEVISVVFTVMLEVFEVTRVSNPAIALVFDAMSLVFVVILAVFEVTLVFNEATSYGFLLNSFLLY